MKSWSRLGAFLRLMAVLCALSTHAWAQEEPEEEAPATEPAAPETVGEEPAAPETVGEEPAAPETVGEEPAAPETVAPGTEEAAPASDAAPGTEDAAPASDAAPGTEEAAAAGGAAPGSDGLDAVQEDEPGNDTYPPEALQYWPKEVLDALPKVMIRFLRIRDYQALDAACPQEDAAGIGACLETEAAQNVLGEQFGRAVVSTLVGYMDAELPNRLAEEDFDAIAEPCEKTGEAWANCILEVIEKDLDADQCDQAEDDLATCIVGHDKVSETFLAIQKERKDVFGPDVFVAFRGLLSVLTLEDLKALRAACPQDDVDALLTCLDGNEVVKAMVDVFQQITQILVEETQTELTAAGKPMSEEQTTQLGERVLDLLFRFPSRVIDNVAKECDTKHPELAKLDDPTKIDQSLQCLEDEAQIDPIANPAYISKEKLLSWLGQGKVKVIGKIREKEIAGQAKAFERMLMILGILAAGGLLFILLRPLFIGKKYPEHKSLLWKASVFAALTFVLTIASLGVTLLVMRTVQGAVMVDSTSPKMRLANAVFDVLEKTKQVEMLSALSQERLDFIKTPLQAVVRETGELAQQENFAAYVAEHWATLIQEPELKSLAKNVKMLKEHSEEMKSALGFFRKVDWIMGYVPILLALLAVLLYLLPMKETLVEIVNAPVKAARGDDPNAFAAAIHTIKGEFKLIVPYLVVMLLFLPIVGIFIALAMEPIVELLLGYLFQTVWYILGADASALVLDLSLGGVILLLVVALVIFILAMGQLLGTLRKILRARFHWGQPLATFGRFFKWAPLASLCVLAFPVLYAYAVHYVAFEIIDPKIDFAALTSMDMLGLPVAGFVLFPILFWALRGFKLMKFVGKYPVVKPS